MGNKYPYDNPETTDSIKEPLDWAHSAARGILYDLSDRHTIKHSLYDIDEDVRIEIIQTISEIIRQAYKNSLTEKG